MKKYMLLSLIVYCWLGFNYCQAQDSTTIKHPDSIVMAHGDSVLILQKMKQLEKGMDNYLQALLHNNCGLMESAMINLLKMKDHYPDLDYSQIIDQLHYLAEQGPTQSLRFLAYFTSHYLEDSENFKWLLQGGHGFASDSDYFFKIVQE